MTKSFQINLSWDEAKPPLTDNTILVFDLEPLVDLPCNSYIVELATLFVQK